jgi:hypothetical protein
MSNPHESYNVHALQTELDRLLSERNKVQSDLHNSGDLKHQDRLNALRQEILTLESAIGDARV